jgi:hypothetical protein
MSSCPASVSSASASWFANNHTEQEGRLEQIGLPFKRNTDMKISLTIGSALLALAALASTADARMMGGGMHSPSSMSRGDIHSTGPSSLGSPRGFSPDGRTFSPDGLQSRVKGSHWKHPIDSDQGGADDPPKKTPKTPKGSTGPTAEQLAAWAEYQKNHPHPWQHGSGGKGGAGGGSSGDTGPALACRGRINGC